MRIISWNVNGLRANVKKGGFDWFLNESPDIYCLQETKAHPDQLDAGIRNPEGYHSYFDHSKGRKGYSGVAIYSRIEPKEIQYGLGIPEYDQEGRFLGLLFENLIKDIPKIALFNNYFPNGGGGPERLEYKLNYYEHFLKHINSLRKQGYEIIFCGDVNTAHKEIDIARPKENANHTGFLPIERAWIDRVVDAGYIDTYRYFNPDKKEAYTWWDMKTFARDRNIGWRLDYFFVSEKLINRVKKVRILDNILGSDHCPVEIVIE